MEEKVAFENFLFGDGAECTINDEEFLADRLIMLPKLRPHCIDKAIRLCEDYCKNEDFRQKLSQKSISCPALIYQLYKKGVLDYEDLAPTINRFDSFVFCYYFRKEFFDFEAVIQSKEEPDDFDESFIENDNEIDSLVEYGYLPSSIEYCLKYDDIDVFRSICTSYQSTAKWSPFEWSCKPEFRDFLSFSGFFGSINCFKHLLMNGYCINDRVMSSVVCSGSFDLVLLCQEEELTDPKCLCLASQFHHLNLLVYMFENGGDIKSRNTEDETSLHYSAMYGHLRVVEYLLDNGADISAKNDAHLTPLHCSAGNGHLRVVEYLVNYGADINAKTDYISI